MQRHRIPIEQYAGNVQALAALAVFAGYHPANAMGALGHASASSLGVGHYSLLALLQQERSTLQAEEATIIAAIEAAGGKRTDTQAARLAEIDTRFGDGKSGPGLLAEMAAEERRRERERSAPATAIENEVAEAAQAKAADAVAKAPTPFHSLGDQLQAVHRAAIQQKRGQQVDERLLAIQDYWQGQAVTGASEIVGSDGGFLVQTDLSNELLTDLISAATLAPLAQTRQVGPNSNGTKFNIFDETSRATGSRYGGVRFYWLAEGGQKTASRPKMKQVEITLQKAAAMYVATDELLADSTALESFVRPAFIEEASFWVDDAMYRGTGVGMPLGILNSGALVTVNKETGQDADTLILENIDKMLVRMLPSSLPKASWYINTELWPQLFGLSQIIGVGGVPVYLPPGSAGASPFGNLRGRPVVPIEYASAPGDLGDITFADWSKYYLLRKGGVEQATSIHVYFDTDETAFRWVLRINGRPVKETSLTPYKGSGTLSPFVTLQAR